MFIVQSESAAHIEEALRILRTWNPSWNPNNFMYDLSETENEPMESIFPGTVVYVCDFHCEQAWERWVKDSKHGASASDLDWLLDQLCACAWVPLAKPSELRHTFQSPLPTGS